MHQDLKTNIGNAITTSSGSRIPQTKIANTARQEKSGTAENASMPPQPITVFSGSDTKPFSGPNDDP